MDIRMSGLRGGSLGADLGFFKGAVCASGKGGVWEGVGAEDGERGVLLLLHGSLMRHFPSCKIPLHVSQA